MKLLVQRVSAASVKVGDETVGEIGHGLLVLVGLEQGDDDAVLNRMSDRLLGYRLFSDEQGKMNLAVTDVPDSGVLLVSQFTLAADTRRGRRPSFSAAMEPARAETAFACFVEQVKTRFSGSVACGRFGADMQVALVNDGPVTFMLES